MHCFKDVTFLLWSDRLSIGMLFVISVEGYEKSLAFKICPWCHNGSQICCFWVGHCNCVFIQVVVSLYLTNYLKSFLLLQPAGFVLANLLAFHRYTDTTWNAVSAPLFNTGWFFFFFLPAVYVLVHLAFISNSFLILGRWGVYCEYMLKLLLGCLHLSQMHWVYF